MVPPTEVTHGEPLGKSAWARVVFGSQLTPVWVASGEESPQSPAAK